MISAYHGIGAYRGQRNPLALRSMLDTALSGVELCAADRPIGAFGAVLLGNCRELFDQDVWSVINEAGRREVSGWCTKSVSEPDQSVFEQFARAAMTERAEYPRAYCEAWVTSCAIRALWVKDWADDTTKKSAAIMAARRGVPLITVSGKTRIWDLLDNQPLPVIPAIYAKRA